MSVCARVWEGRVGGGGMRVTRTVELHGEPGGGGGGGGQAMRTRTQEGRHAHWSNYADVNGAGVPSRTDTWWPAQSAGRKNVGGRHCKPRRGPSEQM